MRKRFVAIGMLLAVLVSGCWSDSGDSHPFDPLPPVDESVPTLAEPRDPAAVEDAARRIDPCVLLKKARAQVQSHHLDKADVTRHASAFACTAAPRRIGSAWVSARVGEDFVSDEDATRTRLAGALAYTNMTLSSGCFAELPIAPGRAVTITTHAPIPRAQRCDFAAKLAGAAARVLRANPDSSIGTPPLPWARCDLLRRALPASQRGAVFATAIDQDECVVVRHTQDVDRPIKLTAPDVVIEVGRPLRIEGRRMYRTREYGSCMYSWKDRRVEPTAGFTPGISVTHPRCEQAEQMARRTLQTLSKGPPQGPPRQRPLTYPAEHADPGEACSYLPFDNPSLCASDLPADAPGDPVDLIRRAEVDPKVSCAMANDEVHERFADQLFPVAATRSPAPEDPGCSFSGMANSVQVWIDASTDPVNAESGLEADLTIDGHPARMTKAAGEVSLAVAYDSLDEPGQLIGTVIVPPGSPDVNERAAALKKLMTDLARKHL